MAVAHSRRVAHGALDKSAFLVDSLDSGPDVRLGNFGLAVVGGADNGDALAEAAHADMRALGLIVAELVFSSLRSGGAPEAGADSMGRVFETIFDLDWGRIREYCAEEPGWAAAVAFLDAGRGAGWVRPHSTRAEPFAQPGAARRGARSVERREARVPKVCCCARRGCWRRAWRRGPTPQTPQTL